MATNIQYCTLTKLISEAKTIKIQIDQKLNGCKNLQRQTEKPPKDWVKLIILKIKKGYLG